MTGVAIALAILTIYMVADFGSRTHRWPVCAAAGLLVTGIAAMAGWALEQIVRTVI